MEEDMPISVLSLARALGADASSKGDEKKQFVFQEPATLASAEAEKYPVVKERTAK